MDTGTMVYGEDAWFVDTRGVDRVVTATVGGRTPVKADQPEPAKKTCPANPKSHISATCLFFAS